MRGWRNALAGDPGGLYLQEAWRSHWLDVKDDLSGQSCTPLTLQRLAWLRDKATALHADLLASGAWPTRATLAAMPCSMSCTRPKPRRFAGSWAIRRMPDSRE